MVCVCGGGGDERTNKVGGREMRGGGGRDLWGNKRTNNVGGRGGGGIRE